MLGFSYCTVVIGSWVNTLYSFLVVACGRDHACFALCISSIMVKLSWYIQHRPMVVRILADD